MNNPYDQHDIAVYAGYVCEDTKLLQSASGGIATALSEHMLSQGGYVAGVAYSEDFYSAEYILIHDLAQLPKLKGSKYVDCNKRDIYAQVKQLLDEGEKVLFFGLPCTVGALYKFLGGRPENLWTCELICHGPTDPRVHRDYIGYLEKKYKSKVVAFSVRHKLDAWMPLYLYAKFENGKTFLRPYYDTEYGYASAVLGKKSCYDCRFKGNDRQADLMIGDFWGATPQDEYWNKLGVSSIFAETEKGDALINATPGIRLFPSTFEKAIVKNSMVIRSREVKPNRDEFAALLEKEGLIQAVRHSLRPAAKLKKFVVRLFPNSFKPKVKNVIRSIKKLLHK